MRTVIALLVLAIAANAYTIKSGGLKGSWATDVAVTGPDPDTTAPTLVSFTLDGVEADFDYNATEGGITYPDIDYEADDANDYSCTLASQMWNEDMTEVVAQFYVSTYPEIYVAPYLPQGRYETVVECTDQTGNSAWWDSAGSTTVFGVNYANHAVDVTPYLTSAFEIDGGTAAITYVITDTVASDSWAVTFDYETDEDSTDPNDLSPVWMGEIYGAWTADGASTDSSVTWTASCFLGTCTAYVGASIDSEPGLYEFTSAIVWDSAGNPSATLTGSLSLEINQDADRTETVVSCQTLVLTTPDVVIDVSTTWDTIDVTLDCTIKDDVTSATAYISYMREQTVTTMSNGVATTELGGLVGNNLLYTESLNSEGTLATSVYLDDGFPEGPYRLQDVSTRTSVGMTQLYTYDLGSASSAAPSVAALVVAAAVALLRL